MDTELPYRTCRELLHQAVVGRVAICTPTGPRIVPINYRVDGESLVRYAQEPDHRRAGATEVVLQ